MGMVVVVQFPTDAEDETVEDCPSQVVGCVEEGRVCVILVGG